LQSRIWAWSWVYFAATPKDGPGAERVARYRSWSRARKGGQGNVGGASLPRSQGGLAAWAPGARGPTRTDTDAHGGLGSGTGTRSNNARPIARRHTSSPLVSLRALRGRPCCPALPRVGRRALGLAGYWARWVLRVSRGRRRPRTIATAAARTRSMIIADHKVAGARLRQRVRKK